VPIGTDTVSKVKLQRLRARKKKQKKYLMTRIRSTPPPQKRWRSKAVEVNQTATKIKNDTTTLHLSAGTTNSPAIKVGPFADDTDRLTLEPGPSALHQDTSNDMPTPMEDYDLLGEDLVDIRATTEHSGMDVNVIMFSVDCTIIGDDEPVVAQFDFGPK
jgi:hypothetical protein